MDASSLPDSWQTLPDEESARRQQLRAEFPLGLAPYTAGNLGRFGFWGGIIGAGIAGVINLRRANQSQAIPRLLLLTFILLMVDWIAVIGISDWLFLSMTNPWQVVGELVLLIASALVGLVYARWIANRQNALSARWFELSGKPDWRVQGGCLAAVGGVIVSIIIGTMLFGLIYPALAPATLQIIHPPQRYMAEGISITVPAGWAQTAPEIVGLNCTTSKFTCLAIVSERMTGTAAIFLINSGIAPMVLANAVAFNAITQNPNLPAQDVQPYTSPFLNNRSAATFTVLINGVTSIYTAVSDGTNTVGFTLNCGGELQPQCEALRDQFISTFEFSNSS